MGKIRSFVVTGLASIIMSIYPVGDRINEEKKTEILNPWVEQENVEVVGLGRQFVGWENVELESRFTPLGVAYESIVNEKKLPMPRGASMEDSRVVFYPKDGKDSWLDAYGNIVVEIVQPGKAYKKYVQVGQGVYEGNPWEDVIRVNLGPEYFTPFMKREEIPFSVWATNEVGETIASYSNGVLVRGR